MKEKPLGLIAVLAVLLLPTACCAQADEYRALWVNAWNSGFESPSATTAMVDYARSCNVNVIVPEIRLRADAYYSSSIEPPGTGVTPTPGYDSLADIIAKAHAVGIEVHPWVVTYRIWTTTSGPPHTTPEHIWYTHGPGNANPAEDWCMYSDTGSVFYGGTSNLDPGHPAVEDYLITVFMDIINRYDVDGFAPDYIRYPATSWGYNAVAVARFNAEYGRTGNPSSGDTLWQDWRRDQISNLAKRLYLEAKAVKPWVKMGAAVWKTAGSGNSGYLQDWDKWMQNHWMDYVSPMMYTSDNDLFHSYLDDAVGRQYGHHIYPLMDASNDIYANVLPQIDLVRSHGFLGMGLYCYSSIPNRTNLKNALVAGPFPSFVNPADMPWLSAPTKGYLKGYVRDTGGNAIYPATVTILGTGFATKDSGTGFYGFSEVTPDTYTVRAEAPGYVTLESPVTITAGLVSDIDFTLQLETVPPVITNVRAENIQATNVQIKWDTDEPATSQVDYGLTTSYGTTTTEDMARVTSHTVQLVGLSPLTTYHFRVRSYDAARNMAESTDYIFSTADTDTPVDIIVDNSNPACTLAGSWFTGTIAAEKYGTNYFYCSHEGGTKTCTWRPNVITAGTYNVYAWWSDGSNRTTVAPYFVQWNGGSQLLLVNQQDPTSGGQWQLLVANVPFAAGTTGYVRVSNSGLEQDPDKVVIADAIRLEYSDTEPPTAPTNLTATALSHSQVSLSWTASTDNVGVAGYYIYRNGGQVGSSTSNSYVDSGLDPNTQYSYYVKAYDIAQNVSGPSNTALRYTLSAAPGSGSVTCDKPVDTWQSTDAFTFTAIGGFGAGTLEYYRYAWDQSPTHSWTGFEPQWSSGDLALTATSSGSWYLHVKGYNAEDLANGSYTYGPYKYDPLAPASTIADAKNRSDGSAVILDDKIVSASFGDHFYICESTADQICGIRVNGTSPAEGDSADVSGVLQTINGERVITAPSIASVSGSGAPDPVFMVNKLVGGSALNAYTPGVTGGSGVNNIGLLIAVAGRVTGSGSGYVLVSDGLELKVDTSTLTVLPTIGDFVQLAGISGAEESAGVITPLVKPRRDSDVVIYP